MMTLAELLVLMIYLAGVIGVQIWWGYSSAVDDVDIDDVLEWVLKTFLWPIFAAGILFAAVISTPFLLGNWIASRVNKGK